MVSFAKINHISFGYFNLISITFIIIKIINLPGYLSDASAERRTLLETETKTSWKTREK